MCEVCVAPLTRTRPAVEACSEGGCLSVSLLELLAFNLTFIFIASVVVLVEVRPCTVRARSPVPSSPC